MPARKSIEDVPPLAGWVTVVEISELLGMNRQHISEIIMDGRMGVPADDLRRVSDRILVRASFAFSYISEKGRKIPPEMKLYHTELSDA